jgi:vacuolar-type H+-ATPase subunit F/Vma7
LSVGGVAAIGNHVRLRGYALAGAELHTAAGEEDLAACWERLPEDVAFLVLTRGAHAALAERLRERPELVWAVVPD